MEQSLSWVAQCEEAVERLHTTTKRAKFHKIKSCQVLAAALAAHVAVENTVHHGGLSICQIQQLQGMCTSTVAAIELAQQQIQVLGAQAGVDNYTNMQRKQSIDRKFDDITLQLDSLAKQAWNLQVEAEVLDDRYSVDICQLLERSLTAESARRTANALSVIGQELVSGRHRDISVSPNLEFLQSGDVVTPDEAIGMLNELKLLLAASSSEVLQTRPSMSRNQESGQTASFDSSSRSYAEQQSASSAFCSNLPPSVLPSQAHPQPSTGKVLQAGPPPPGHAGDTFQPELPGSRRTSESAQSSQQAEPVNFLKQASFASDWSGEGGFQRSSRARSTSSASPFDMAHRRSAEQEHSLREPEVPHSRRRSAEQQRTDDWTGQQMRESGNSSNSRRLSSYTGAELSALQARDRGMQSEQQPLLSDKTRDSQLPGSGRGFSAELKAPSVSGQYSSRASSIEMFESLNCPIVDYDQLQMKRKIGDGSIGLVYLGKWQETDVAVKVLIEMQHLAANSEVQPQDPATLEPWKGSEEDNHPQQGGEKSKTAGGLRGVTDPNASLTGESTLDVGSGPALTPEAQTAIKTLEREVSIMASLRHPNVVMFMGMCLEPPCIITEFCARGSLFDVLRKARTSPPFAQQLDWSKRLSMALDAAKGVLHLHSHKPTILHRDLKSPNMLVERYWRVKITDFNLSRMVQTSSAGSSVNSLLANNPRWLAPEVVADHEHSKAADVYSFGIIMWELMTWDIPWEELNAFQIILRLQQQDRPELPPLCELPGQPLPGITDYIKLMKDCWSQEPSKRPGFEHVIITIRGLLEGAATKQKVQKTISEVPRLATTSMVPPNMNKLPVVGQTPYKAEGADPQDTPTPLRSDAKQTPLQIYETERAFFGSAPVGGLDILCSQTSGNDQLEHAQYHPLSGAGSQQDIRKIAVKNKGLTRRNTYNGTSSPMEDLLGTAPSFPGKKQPQHAGKH